MKRVRSWEADLAEWASAVRGLPFAWGTTDCASLARRAVAICHGEDPAPDLDYDDLRSARRALKSKTFEEWLREAGAELVPGGVAFAQGGDILVGDDREVAGLPAVAVYVGGLWLVSSQAEGVRIGRLEEEPALAEAALYRFPMDGIHG